MCPLESANVLLCVSMAQLGKSERKGEGQRGRSAVKISLIQNRNMCLKTIKDTEWIRDTHRAQKCVKVTCVCLCVCGQMCAAGV